MSMAVSAKTSTSSCTPLINLAPRSGRLVRLFPEMERPGSWRFVMCLRPGVANDRTVRMLNTLALLRAK